MPKSYTSNSPFYFKSPPPKKRITTSNFLPVAKLYFMYYEIKLAQGGLQKKPRNNPVPWLVLDITYAKRFIKCSIV